MAEDDDRADAALGQDLRRLRAQEDLRNDRGVAQPADRKFIVNDVSHA